MKSSSIIQCSTTFAQDNNDYLDTVSLARNAIPSSQVDPLVAVGVLRRGIFISRCPTYEIERTMNGSEITKHALSPESFVALERRGLLANPQKAQVDCTNSFVLFDDRR